MGYALERLPDWPAAMPRDLALAYTQVAETQMREWERNGVVRFRPRGPKGALLALKADLDLALETLFAADNDPAGPLEF